MIISFLRDVDYSDDDDDVVAVVVVALGLQCVQLYLGVLVAALKRRCYLYATEALPDVVDA